MITELAGQLSLGNGPNATFAGQVPRSPAVAAPHYDVGMTEKFTDEELTFLRHARFGELPERVEPEDYVEMTETEPPPEQPVERHNPNWGTG